MSAAAGPAGKVLPLRRRTTPSESWASRTAGEVRRNLSLLQGYADLMEGMSAAQSVQVLRVMAEKVSDLTESLRPFLQQDLATRNIEDYRQTRVRRRQLLAEYRTLLERLSATLTEAHATIPDATASRE